MLDYKYFVKEEIKAGKPFITVNVNYQADEVAVRTISFAKPPFLPPMAVSEVNNENSFSFDITAGGFMRVSDLPREMTPLEFLLVMKNITDAIIKSDDYFLMPRNLLLIDNYIYVNPENFNVRLIYMPFVDGLFNAEDVNKHVYDLSRRFSRATTEEWNAVIRSIWGTSERTSVFEANTIYNDLYNEMLEASKKASATTPPKPKPATPIAASTPIPTPPNPSHAVESKSIYGSGKTPDMPKDTEKSKGIFGLFGGKKKPDAASEEITLAFVDENLTMVDEGSKQLPNAKLILLEDGKPVTEIPITKSEFLLGRNRDSVDFTFDSDSDRGIGRIHAMVQYDGINFNIVDQLSTNGTYLNNVRLEPNTPIPLSNGDTVKVHRKELLFSLSL